MIADAQYALPKQQRRYYTAGMFCLVATLLSADQNLLAPNLTAVAKDFGFTDAQRDKYLGGVISAAFFLLGAPAALLIGYLSDTMNRAKLLFWVVVLGMFASSNILLPKAAAQRCIALYSVNIVHQHIVVCLASCLPKKKVVLPAIWVLAMPQTLSLVSNCTKHLPTHCHKGHMRYMRQSYNPSVLCESNHVVQLAGEGPCLLTYFVTSYWQLFVLRALTGISIGGCLPLLFNLLGDLFDAQHRANVLSGVLIATGAGTAIGQALAGGIGTLSCSPALQKVHTCKRPTLALDFHLAVFFTDVVPV